MYIYIVIFCSHKSSKTCIIAKEFIKVYLFVCKFQIFKKILNILLTLIYSKIKVIHILEN